MLIFIGEVYFTARIARTVTFIASEEICLNTASAEILLTAKFLFFFFNREQESYCRFHEYCITLLRSQAIKNSLCPNIFGQLSAQTLVFLLKIN